VRPILALLLAVCAVCAACRGEPRAAAPAPAVPVPAVPAGPNDAAPTGGRGQPALALPRPPAQDAPWTPPPGTTLPPPLLTATRALFDEGLADPRSLEYRAVTITVGDVWSGNGSPLETHAWLLPPGDAGNAGGRFVVAWNGLVYPALRVGDAADLAADVTAVVSADEKMRADYAKDNPGHDYYRFRHAWPEGTSASQASLLPLKAVLLLRLGQTKLAEGVWGAWTGGMRASTNDDARHLADPYLMLATDWTWAAFDRAVCGHMRGDDPVSFATAAALVPIRSAVVAEGGRRGLLALDASANDGALGFLAPLDTLVEDEARRMARPARLVADDAGSPAAPPGDGSVAALVDDLELVSARQWGQPGGVSLGEDPVVQALIAKREEAVEPLLAVLENDTRLTRSVHFWRDFAHHRSLLSVGEAAYVALAGILDASFFGAGSTGDDLSAHGLEGRKRVAAEIRAYWERWRGVSTEERWFRVLASDDLPPQRWLEAAGNIARPDNVTVVPSSMVWSSTLTTSTATRPGLRGEALRSKRGPSVTELMAGRVETLAGRPDGMDAANEMALLLHAWDGAGSLPALQKQMGRCLAAMGGGGPPADRVKYGRALAALAEARAAEGDRSALDEYAAWIAPLRPADFGTSSYDLKPVLEPMAHFPGDPAVVRASTAMFARAGSPWESLTRGPAAWGIRELAGSDLLRVAAFRDVVVRGLGDRTKMGTLKNTNNGGVSIALDNGGSIGTGVDTGEAAPPAGTTFIVRGCDLVAWEVAKREHSPVFRIYWPQPRRDAAIAALASFVRAVR
jgi:hypothetical protein